MSFYNILFGVNEMEMVLKKILELDEHQPPKPPAILTYVSKTGEEYFNFESVVEGKDGAEEAWQEYKKQCVEAKWYPTGRFRDIYLNRDGTKIILYTRNGGGNREYYEYVFELLRKHPNYLTDYDDDFDNTYAYIEFSVPEAYQDLCRSLSTGENPQTVAEKFNNLFKKWSEDENERMC